MAQANEAGGKMTAEEFKQLAKEAHFKRHMEGRRHGPCYSEGESAPLVWHDQVFEREITPDGTLICETPLRVGATHNGLDVILVASHANTADLIAASGATVTFNTLQADTPMGPFEAVGPSICVTAPAEGISAEPDHLFVRVPLGNFKKPWLKLKLEFSGSISGGQVDAALSYAAR